MTIKPPDPYEGTITTLDARQELKDRSQLLLYQIAEKRPLLQRNGGLDEHEINSFFEKIEDVEEALEGLSSFDINAEEKRVLLEAEEKFNKALDRLDALDAKKNPVERNTTLMEALALAEEGAMACKEIAEGLNP